MESFETQNKSFEEYLNLLLEVGYQTQYSFLGGNEFIDYVDYIGYFENLKKDWQKIAEIIGIKQYKLPKKNLSPENKKIVFSKNELSLVNNLYEEDFNRFYPNI